MLEWLKTILGDNYNEETDKKVSEQIGKDFVARSDFNSVNETKKSLETTVKDRDKQLEELKKVDPKALQDEIAKLQGENKTAQATYEASLKQLKIDTALETRLHEEGAVNTKAVRALLDTTKLGLDGEKLIGLDDQLKALKETEKWAFSTNGKTTGAKSGTHQGNPPPASTETTVGDEILSTMYGKTEE